MSTRIGWCIGAAILSLAVMGCVSMGSGSVGSSGQLSPGAGYSVAMSADGSTLAVGDPQHGSVAVFVRSNEDWKSAAALSAAGVPTTAHFGSSVAVSQDGAVVFVGAPDEDAGSDARAGRVYVFVRPGGSWNAAGAQGTGGTPGPAGAPPVITKPTDTVASMDQQAGARFGASLATSLLGRSVVVGAPGQSEGQGATYVASSGSWGGRVRVIAMFRLGYHGATPGDAFGSSVAVSTDGSFVAAGAPGRHEETGSVLVFKRPDSEKGWNDTPAIRLMEVPAPEGAPGDRFGESVALTKGGDRIFVGDPSPRGRSRVYLVELDWSGGGSLHRMAALFGPDNTTSMGRSIAVASDGGVIVSGAYRIRSNQGLIVILKEEKGAWDGPYETSLLAPKGWETGDLGASVTISADGTELVAGAPKAKGGAGDYLSSPIERDPARAANAALYAAEVSEIGSSVAISADGATSIVGVPRGSATVNGCGYVWLYEKAADGWQYRTTLSAGKAADAGDEFGAAVALSADGSVAVVGAPKKGSSGVDSQGAVFVFVRPSSGWPREGKAPDMSFTSAEPAAGEAIGSSVAVSADGSLIVVGAPGFARGQGSAFYLVRPSGGWGAERSQSALPLELRGLDLRPGDGYGHSVAVSGDGSFIAVGAPGRGTTGLVVIAQRPAAGWQAGGNGRFSIIPGDTAKLQGLTHLGKSLVVTEDGKNILAGVDNSDPSTGTVFRVSLEQLPGNKTGLTMFTLDSEIKASFKLTDFGHALGVSADGKVLAIGSLGEGGAGEVKIVKYLSEPLHGEFSYWLANVGAPIEYGWAVAVSGDGSEALVGAPHDKGGSGSIEHADVAKILK